MELKDIVSIAGMPGLHKVIGRNKTGLIVETIGTGKKFATNERQRVSVLADIAIFTDEGEAKLWEAFKSIKSLADEGKDIPTSKSSDDEVKSAMALILPKYDREKVYTSDMKKLFSWYHMVKDALDFDKLGQEDTEETTEVEGAEKPAAKAKEKAAPKQVKSQSPRTSSGVKSKTTTPRKMGS